MKKTKDKIMAAVTFTGLILMLIGAASIESDAYWIPILMMTVGAVIAFLTNKLYWHMD